MFGSGKKDDDAGAGRPRGGRAPRRRFDPELIPYGVGLLVFLLVLVVYLTSVGDADAEGAGAVEKIERAFMRSIDSVENEIVDIGKRLAEGLPDSRELGSMMSGREGEHYESLLSAISDGSESVGMRSSNSGMPGAGKASVAPPKTDIAIPAASTARIA